ncbi:nuclear GTPase SLIP-GC-like isoform X2 [Lagopus muta]|uniref:nuclear GTPase SLIP-GC-like isoform X2 n=1 Tax=Lagopus muta TaxID=64668 RepID=UPI00209D6F89|nr:nuclear GTPase SLIP-GC-like isoform X2 [Lagopus muta]
MYGGRSFTRFHFRCKRGIPGKPSNPKIKGGSCSASFSVLGPPPSELLRPGSTKGQHPATQPRSPLVWHYSVTMAEGCSRPPGGNDDLLEETPKKKSRRDLILEDGERETLKNCKRMQSELKTILEKSSQKLSQFLPVFSQPGAREGILYLRNRLTSLKPDILMDPIYIGLFGSTGAGKSTLLNAIIDKNFFLPVSGSSACTSCVVQINTSRSKQHEAKIHLLTDEEWKDELKGLVAFLDPSEDSEDNSERSEAALKISAIYGKGAETKSYEELCRMKPIVSIPPSRCIIFRETTAEKLSDKMCPYIRSPTSAVGEMKKEDTKMRIWPLIKNVEVTLPYSQVIPEGVVFVDIPGTGDFNSKRDEMWKENINKCSVIWVVNSIQRILGEKIHEMLLREGMKAFQSGMCRDISLVATKSDDLNLEEYRWEKKKKNINKHDAILERNAAVKQEKSRMIKKKLEEKLPNDLEVVHKADLVYTVSAREYWQEEMLSKEETEIPKLREYVRGFYVKQKRNVLMDHTMEAFTIFSLICSLQANKHAQYQLAKRNHLREIMVQKIADLEKDIKECFLPIEQPLKEGVEEAKSATTGTKATIRP